MGEGDSGKGRVNRLIAKPGRFAPQKPLSRPPAKEPWHLSVLARRRDFLPLEKIPAEAISKPCNADLSHCDFLERAAIIRIKHI
jgi:hypothetical protein